MQFTFFILDAESYFLSSKKVTNHFQRLLHQTVFIIGALICKNVCSREAKKLVESFSQEMGQLFFANKSIIEFSSSHRVPN